jgi:hypothetical protein
VNTIQLRGNCSSKDTPYFIIFLFYCEGFFLLCTFKDLKSVGVTTSVTLITMESKPN